MLLDPPFAKTQEEHQAISASISYVLAQVVDLELELDRSRWK